MGVLQADEEDMGGRRSQQQISTSLPLSISRKGMVPPMFLMGLSFPGPFLLCTLCSGHLQKGFAKVLPSIGLVGLPCLFSPPASDA